MIYFLNEPLSFLAVALLYIPAIAILIFILPDIGYIILFFYTGFFWILDRFILGSFLPFPAGITIDALLLLVLSAYVLRYNHRFKTRYLKSPITVALLIYLLFLLFQLGNPNGTVGGWLLSIRILLRIFVIVAISIYFFSHKSNIYLFIKVWYFLVMANAFYASYQLVFGIPDYEINHALQIENFAQLNFIHGKWRIWSLMQSSTDFGLFMASSGMFFLVYANQLKHGSKKLVLYGSSMLMLFLSSASGTRTATAITVIGFAFFILFNIHKVKYILLTFVVALMLMIILFGPIYTPKVMRIRSTFFPKDDPSFVLREIPGVNETVYIF